MILFNKQPQFQIPNLEADGSSFQVKCKVIDLSSAQIPRNSSQSRYHTDDRFQQELLFSTFFSLNFYHFCLIIKSIW